MDEFNRLNRKINSVIKQVECLTENCCGDKETPQPPENRPDVIFIAKNIQARNAFPCEKRLNGMISIVIDEGYKQYQLKVPTNGDICNNANWHIINEETPIDPHLRNVYYFTDLNEGADYVDTNSTPDGSIAYVLSEDKYYKIKNGGFDSLFTIPNIKFPIPDEEDLTLVTLPNGNEIIKLSDRAYTPATATGFGYTILRMEDANHFLRQAHFKANTIYDIRYDFDLDGEEIIMPENVTLMFNGGSIRNGIINGNFTRIEAGLEKIFDTWSLEFTGTFNINNVFPEWFGAKSIPVGIDDELVNTIPNFNTRTIDNTDFINRAFDLASLGNGQVSLNKGAYRIDKTINIQNYCTLDINPKAVVVPLMSGKGNLVDNGPRVYALRRDQFFPTANMKTAISMEVTSRITGRGYVCLRHSDYTIGILLKGRGFNWTDMTFSTRVDVKVVGGGTWSTASDPDTLFGDGVPANSLGNNGDWYMDKQSYETSGRGQLYTKTNNTWSSGGVSVCIGNTSFRAEANGWDYRIISMDMSLWDIYGYRGVEIIAINGGWINDSRWTGTVSNKQSNFISFFGSGAKLHHDMTAMDYQTDNFMMAECRVIYAEGDTGQNELGYTWDLDYLSFIKYPIKYEFRQGTYLNKFPHEFGGIKDKYILDEGRDNDFGFGKYIPSLSDLGSTRYRELFPNGNSPLTNGQGLMYIIPSHSPNLSTVFTNTVALDSYKDYPSEIFTDDDTYATVIDTTKGIYGKSIRLWNIDGDYATGHIYARIRAIIPTGYPPVGSEIRMAIMNYLGLVYDSIITLDNYKMYEKLINSFNSNAAINLVFYIKGDPGTTPIKLDIGRFQAYADRTLIQNGSRININNKFTKGNNLITPVNIVTNSEKMFLSQIPRTEPGGSFYASYYDLYLTNRGDSKTPLWLPNHIDSVKLINSYSNRTPLSYYGLTSPDNTIMRTLKYTDDSITLDQMLIDCFNVSKFGETLPKQWFDEQPNTYANLLNKATTGNQAVFGLDFSALSLRGQNQFVVIEYVMNDAGIVNAKARVQYTSGRYYEQDYPTIYAKSNTNGGTSSGFIIVPITYNNLYVPIQQMAIAFKGDVNVNNFEIVNVKLYRDTSNTTQAINKDYGPDNLRPSAPHKGLVYYNTSYDTYQVNTGDAVTPTWKNLVIAESGGWTAPDTSIVNAFTGLFSKVDKQITLSGTCTVLTVDTESIIVLPFAPDFGINYICGDVIIRTVSNSTNAYISSASAGSGKNFQISYKTL